MGREKAVTKGIHLSVSMCFQEVVSLISLMSIFLPITRFIQLLRHKVGIFIFSGFIWKVAPNQLQHTGYCPTRSEVMIYGDKGEVHELARLIFFNLFSKTFLAN